MQRKHRYKCRLYLAYATLSYAAHYSAIGDGDSSTESSYQQIYHFYDLRIVGLNVNASAAASWGCLLEQSALHVWEKEGFYIQRGFLFIECETLTRLELTAAIVCATANEFLVSGVSMMMFITTRVLHLRNINLERQRKCFLQ